MLNIQPSSRPRCHQRHSKSIRHGLALISMATLGKAEQTKRILKAIANPHTTILGHVTGRQLLRRPGYEVDMETILKACAKQGSRRRTPSP